MQVHYTCSLEDGTVVDSTRERGEPQGFLIGAGQAFRGVERAVLEVEPGGTGWLSLEPPDAFGAPQSRGPKP